MADWQNPNRVEERYGQTIRALMDQLFSDFDYNDPFGFSERVNSFVQSDDFLAAANDMARRMVGAVLSNHRRAWKDAVYEQGHAQEMHRLLAQAMAGAIGDAVQAQVDWNAYLISSTPIQISRWITTYAAEQQQAGRRGEDIALDLQKHIPSLTKARSNLIARTECGKASTALTRAQSQDLGINWFLWHGTHDSRTRRAHRELDGVLMHWGDLPAPEALAGEKNVGRYGPGEIYNCRCYAEPVISIDYIDFPVRVYMNGAIRSMTKSQFLTA